MGSIAHKTVENIVLPLATRAGAALSGVLIGLNVNPDHATSMGGIAQTAIVVGALVAVDLVTSWMNRRRVANKAAVTGSAKL